MKMNSIAIIGTAGSRDNMVNFSKVRFEAMVEITDEIIRSTGLNWNEVELWSGGSSGADHVAVALALKHGCKLRLFLPCRFSDGKFIDNGKYDYRQNNGKQLNDLHSKFSRKVGMGSEGCVIASEGCFSLAQLQQVLSSENHTVYNGYFERNKQVALADSMIALTADSEVKDGGTKYTWERSTSNSKLHLDIRNLPY